MWSHELTCLKDFGVVAHRRLFLQAWQNRHAPPSQGGLRPCDSGSLLHFFSIGSEPREIFQRLYSSAWSERRLAMPDTRVQIPLETPAISIPDAMVSVPRLHRGCWGFESLGIDQQRCLQQLLGDTVQWSNG